MDFKITLNRIEEVGRSIGRAVQAAESEVAEHGAEQMRASIRSGKKTGRTYKRKGKGSYTASAPGESPANVSGDLADSIRASSSVDGSGSEIVVSDRIAHTMEHGTAGGKVAARPFASPVADDLERTMPDAITKAVRSVTG